MRVVLYLSPEERGPDFGECLVAEFAAGAVGMARPLGSQPASGLL